MSDHIQVKCLQPYDKKEAKYRPIEIQELVRALTSADERLIMLQGLYGDGKDTIAKSCLHFIADRKYFLKGIIYLNLMNVNSCMDFHRKFRQTIKYLNWSN